MCGRARLADDYSEIKIRLKFDNDIPAPNFEASHNLPPTTPMFVATTRRADGRRVGEMMHWGLIPRWSKAGKYDFKYPTINARSEEFTTKASYRAPWKDGQRCLIVVNNFYEWKKLDAKTKQAYAVAMADGKLMVMAGLWERWTDRASGEEKLSCTVLTCGPNKTMAEVHNRMPVILDEKDWPAWLGEAPATEAELLALLRPCPDEWLNIWPVDNAVGNVKNKGADLILPLKPQ